MPSGDTTVIWSDLFIIIPAVLLILSLILGFLHEAHTKADDNKNEIVGLWQKVNGEKSPKDQLREEHHKQRENVLALYKRGSWSHEHLLSSFYIWDKGTPWEGK